MTISDGFQTVKSLIRRGDDVLLNKTLQRLRNSVLVHAFRRGFGHRLVIHYSKNCADLLSELCDKYGSDKGEVKKGGHPYPWPSHSYADFYSRLFLHCRYNVKRVFECGIGTNNPRLVSSMGGGGKPGASLRVWRDFFPNAIIFGADIDRDVLFEESRIKTFYMDQLDPRAVAAFWTQAGLADFDLIIDDGLHTLPAGICLFEHSISKLAKQGIYVIEDVSLSDLSRYKTYFQSREYVVDYVNLYRPDMTLGDNNLVVIRYSQ